MSIFNYVIIDKFFVLSLCIITSKNNVRSNVYIMSKGDDRFDR